MSCSAPRASAARAPGSRSPSTPLPRRRRTSCSAGTARDGNFKPFRCVKRSFPMTIAEFKSSLSGAAPAGGLSPPLAALWWAAKGDWSRAHAIVQHSDGVDAAWVHAYLHRIEGDTGNAGYWYRRAGQAVATAPVEAEWEHIVTAFLDKERS